MTDLSRRPVSYQRPKMPRALTLSERMNAKAVLRFAEEIGYAKGAANLHHENRTFETGAEYLAWLAGHRRGYAELLEKVASEDAAVRVREQFMRSQFE